MPSLTLVWEAGVADAAARTPARTLENRITRGHRESNQPITLHKIYYLTKGAKLIVDSEDGVKNLQTPFIIKNLQEKNGLVFQPSLDRLANCTLMIRPYNLSPFAVPNVDILTSARRAAGLPPFSTCRNMEEWETQHNKNHHSTQEPSWDSEEEGGSQ